MSKTSIMQAFRELDYFTQRQIINEFPEIFPEYGKQPIDTTPHDHFPPRKFSMNEFYGAFLVIISIIGIVGYTL